MRNSVYIWVDDLRDNPYNNTDVFNTWLINYESATFWINEYSKLGFKIYIDLDHDLGEQKTGYDICKYIVENQIPNVKFRLHTSNPVGRFNMYQLLTHYGYEEF